MGLFAGPDDMYLALRGLRTLDVRLERHMKNALSDRRAGLPERPEVDTRALSRSARRPRP